MKRAKHIYLYGVAFIAAGANHFLNTPFYVSIKKTKGSRIKRGSGVFMREGYRSGGEVRNCRERFKAFLESPSSGSFPESV
ncbi:MAG: hypothetical protein K0S45_136 [Nitrospira sp.]|jgi:hypothetical protein|nr:hypothetical protein [Nitrospira sp.]